MTMLEGFHRMHLQKGRYFRWIIRWWLDLSSVSNRRFLQSEQPQVVTISNGKMHATSSPHSKKVQSYGVCMFFLCAGGFSPGTPILPCFPFPTYHIVWEQPKWHKSDEKCAQFCLCTLWLYVHKHIVVCVLLNKHLFRSTHILFLKYII